MEETISDRLERLERGFKEVDEVAPKQFKLPLGSRFSKGKVMKKEWVHVMMIRSNGSFQIKTCKIEDDTVRFGDYFYDARAGNVLRWKGMPVIVLKEWNISPETNPEKHKLDIEKDYDEASKKGNLTAAQKLILTKMKMEAIKPKMQFNMGMIMIILVVLGGGYFLLSSIGVI
jgi:hypothetical protein